MRTAVLCRLALHLGLSADEHRVQEWVKLYDDAGVWRRIEQSQPEAGGIFKVTLGLACPLGDPC